MWKHLVIAALIAGPPSLVAQAPPPGFVATVEVRVVDVEVMVTDSSGNRIPDLGPADFALYEDGRLMKVSNFYRIVDGNAQLDPAQLAAGFSPQDERFRRRILLVVDDNFLDKTTRRQALDGVRDYVAERFGGDAEWAVAAIGERLQFLMPFTRERFQVAAALDEIERLPTYASFHQLDRSLANDPIRQQYLRIPEGQTMAGPDLGQENRFTSREQLQRNLHSFATMARVLGGLMRSFGGLGGRKAIVLVSGKMEFHPEASNLVSADPNTVMDTGLTQRTQSDPSIEGSRKQLEAVLDALVRGANSAGFQLYTLNAAGLTNPVRMHDAENRQLGNTSFKDTASYRVMPELSDLDTAPRTLSDGTGGLALRSNQLEDDLARVMADTASYYSLGYQPDHPPDHAYHRISVKVARSGLKVRYREGYVDLTESEKLEEELATPLSFPKPKGTLPVELEVVEAGHEGKTVNLEARIALPMKDLTLLPGPKDGVLRAQPEVYLAVYDEKGNNLTVQEHSFPVEVPVAEEAAVKAGSFKPILRFALPPGAYTVTVTVRDPVIHEYGTALSPVLAGEPKKA